MTEKKQKSKRTKKEFTPYNEYVDRSFGMKWGTAFAMDELVKTIEKGKKAETRIVEELPMMSREEIDEVLRFAFLKSKAVSIQLSARDHTGRLYDNVEGKFTGMADETYLYLEDGKYAWDDIRNIGVK